MVELFGSMMFSVWWNCSGSVVLFCLVELFRSVVVFVWWNSAGSVMFFAW
jgi:hypothetical protein